MTDVVDVGHPAQFPPVDAVEDIDVDNEMHKNSVHQRLRANSSIMQVKKILGKFIFTS
jgi:hypothetical protein